VARIRARRFTDEVTERGAEGTKAPKADREAHLGDRELRAPEKLLGALDPTTLEGSVWRFAERSFETAHEMRS
jgi:hypothetical protein